MKYESYFRTYLTSLDETLESLVPLENPHSPLLHEAMRYSVFPGGKRFRAVLTLSACEATGGRWQEALVPAAAVELIHTYSLVHDDLPALDNDEMRRGRPTVHKRFGEAIAILTGDALLTLAFQSLARIQPAAKSRQLVEEISTAAGSYGMIGGQVADLTAATGEISLPQLEYIHIHKTGKLIKASAVSGAVAAGASAETRQRMLKYGECLGLAFQYVDDLLDGDGYARLIKPGEIRQRVRDLIAQGKREVKPLGRKGERLQVLADFLLRRLPKRPHVQVDR